jgi:hypothetical protein
MPSKYNGLAAYLKSLDSPRWTARFDEIEEKLGFALPPSAQRHPAWWSNQTADGHSQNQAWKSSGWHTSRLDLANQRVTFVRDGEAEDEGQPVSSVSPTNDRGGITIAEAKARLSIKYGVPPENVRITIEG